MSRGKNGFLLRCAIRLWNGFVTPESLFRLLSGECDPCECLKLRLVCRASHGFEPSESFKILILRNLVPYENWFREQQRIQKMGGKIVSVKLATGIVGANTGLQ